MKVAGRVANGGEPKEDGTHPELGLGAASTATEVLGRNWMWPDASELFGKMHRRDARVSLPTCR